VSWYSGFFVTTPAVPSATFIFFVEEPGAISSSPLFPLA